MRSVFVVVGHPFMQMDSACLDFLCSALACIFVRFSETLAGRASGTGFYFYHTDIFGAEGQVRGHQGPFILGDITWEGFVFHTASGASE